MEQEAGMHLVKHRSLVGQALMFMAVGGLNTLTTLVIIFLLLWIGWGLVVSNFVGYAVGLMISCLLNAKFTFEKRMSYILLAKFLIAASFAYLANLATIMAARSVFGNSYVVQLLGMPVYTLVFFIVNKLWAMK